MRSVAEMVGPFLDNRLVALGTDGFGRSETRQALRRFFEIDAPNVAHAALTALADRGELDRSVAVKAVKELGLDADAPPPWTV
jgi:pyruvate dehydrogenase E1 component